MMHFRHVELGPTCLLQERLIAFVDFTHSDGWYRLVKWTKLLRFL